jgi:tetratricopeptide (TPR) repeat protein
LQEALLGAGWADAERGNYEAALTPWLRLVRIGGNQPAAHEARLAVPYSFAQLGDRERAIYFYEEAIDYYDSEQAGLETAIQAVESGALLKLLSQADTLESGGWLHDAPALEGIPSGRYLVDVISRHAFQENLKDYRDLGFLQELLTRKLNNIDLLNDMVDTRRLAYEERAPGIREQISQQKAQALQTRWLELSTKLETLSRDNDPLALSTGKEQQQLATLDKVQNTLASLPDDHKRKAALQDKARWLRGVLYWQIQSDYPTRRRNVQKQLQHTEQPVEDLLAKHHRIEQALETVPASFTGYDERIETLRQRIHALMPGIRNARDHASQQIYDLAMLELGARRERLISYRAQARYALARNYDQLAGTHDEELPQ